MAKAKFKTMLLIKPDGTESEVQVPNGQPGGLQAMYRLIECDTVQLVALDHGRLMWCDEEAKLKPNPAPVNWKATQLLAMAGGMPGDHVLGNVLIQSSRKNSPPLPKLVNELIILDKKGNA